MKINRRKILYLVPLFVLVITPIFAACSGSPVSGIQPGAQAPAFTMQTADGGTVSIEDYAGKQPVLLFFHMAVG